MPGTIQVSVLGFVGFPSSSPHSSMSLKVSMGKREFQTWNCGEFFFPLTSLCDLIITLLDAEGNAISHTGVKTTLVIEKGLWEDIFPLEGGGHVHMKLEFFLSEEDHNRIQTMRDSALKKKYGEYVGRCQFSDVADIFKCDKISDSKACLPDLQAINTAEISIQSNQSTYPNASCKDPRYGDKSEEQSLTVSASEAVETKITKRGIEEKRITVSPENGRSEQALMTTPASQQVKPNINEREMVVNTMVLSSEVGPLEEQLDLEQSERQEHTQSTVRRMIHALEGSSLQQDVDLGDNQKISTNPRKKNIETAGGPVGQAIKMIIMVGFGLLVLLTRRRETR